MNDSQKELLLKAVDNGVELSERQIVELMLDGCDKKLTGADAAYNLFERCGNLVNICDMSYDVLKEIPGVGPDGARILKSARAAVDAFLRANSSGDKPRLYFRDEVIRYIRPTFICTDSELMYFYYLNDKHKLVHHEIIGRGDRKDVIFNYGRALKLGCLYDAVEVIVAHNHKTSTAPSQSDIVITRDLQTGYNVIGIKLVDHLIFCEDDVLSMRDEGIIKDPYNPVTLSNFPKER